MKTTMRERFSKVWGGYDSRSDTEGLDKKVLSFFESELKGLREAVEKAPSMGTLHGLDKKIDLIDRSDILKLIDERIE
jgi:hypothetical protein